jgi:hypothetical protein
MLTKLVAFLAFTGLLATALSFTQTAGGIDSDPHYSQLMANDQVRVYQVSLRPGEQSFVRHDHNFLLVALQDCEVAMWPEGRSDIMKFHFAQGSVGFYFGGRGVGIRNEQTTTYQNVTVEFLDPKVTTYSYQSTSGNWDYGASGINPPTDPHAAFTNRLLLGPATATDVQLLPGGFLPIPEHLSSELLIPVTDVDLRSGTDRIRRSPGDGLWIPAGRKSRLVNAASEPARFVVVEFKESAGN